MSDWVLKHYEEWSGYVAVASILIAGAVLVWMLSKDAARMGREAVRMVLERLEDPSRPNRRVEIQACLLIRESTGAAPIGDVNL